MNLKVLGFAGCLLLSTWATQAEGIFEISPQFGYRWGGDLETSAGRSLTLDGGRAYGLALDFVPSRDSGLKFEVLWSRQESGFDWPTLGGNQSLDMTVDEFQIGGVLESSYGRLHGHVTGLIGATLFSPEGAERETRFSLSIGGGVKYFLMKNFALRADLRGYCTIVESEGAFLSVGGVTVARFSGSTLWQGEATAGITLSF